MRESKIEKYFKYRVETNGGMAWKFVSPGRTGVPDRMVLAAMGRVVFVELKAPGEKIRPLQVKRHQELESLGFKVYTLDSIDAVDEFVKEELGYDSGVLPVRESVQ